MGGVGKTSIKQVFTGQKMDDEYTATVGTDFSLKDHVYKNGTESTLIRFMIYDLAGQERYKSGRSNFISGSHAGILVYDVSNRASLDDIPEWLVQFKSVIRTNVPLVLVANKIDLRGKVDYDVITTEEGQKMAEKLQENIGYGKRNKFYFIEVSALENINIDAVFDYISHQIYDMYLAKNEF
jgi:small GTP-binding protein